MDSQTEAVASDVESEPIGSIDGSTVGNAVKSKPVFMGPGGVDSARVASNASSIEDDTQTGIFPAAVTRALRPSAINDDTDAGIDLSNVSSLIDTSPESGWDWVHTKIGRMIVIVLSTAAVTIIVLSLASGLTSRIISDSDDTGTQDASISQSAPVEEDAAPSPEAEEDAVTPSLKTVDLSGVKGQKWSNAIRILESRGVSVTSASSDELLLITDDGGTPIVESNWTVEDITRDDNGLVTVTLKHDTDPASDTGNTISDLASKGKDAWNNLSDGTAGMGEH